MKLEHFLALRVEQLQGVAAVVEVAEILPADGCAVAIAVLESGLIAHQHHARSGGERGAEREGELDAFHKPRAAQAQRRAARIHEFDELEIRCAHAGNGRRFRPGRRRGCVAQFGNAELVLRGGRRGRPRLAGEQRVIGTAQLDGLPARGKRAGVRPGDQPVLSARRARGADAKSRGRLSHMQQADVIGARRVGRDDGAAGEGELHRAGKMPAGEIDGVAAVIPDDKKLVVLVRGRGVEINLLDHQRRARGLRGRHADSIARRVLREEERAPSRQERERRIAQLGIAHVGRLRRIWIGVQDAHRLLARTVIVRSRVERAGESLRRVAIGPKAPILQLAIGIGEIRRARWVDQIAELRDAHVPRAVCRHGGDEHLIHQRPHPAHEHRVQLRRRIDEAHQIIAAAADRQPGLAVHFVVEVVLRADPCVAERQVLIPRDREPLLCPERVAIDVVIFVPPIRVEDHRVRCAKIDQRRNVHVVVGILPALRQRARVRIHAVDERLQIRHVLKLPRLLLRARRAFERVVHLV